MKACQTKGFGLLLAAAMLLSALPKQVYRASAADSTALIASLEVLDSEHAASWSLKTDLAPGDRIYGDREMVYSGLPRMLLGADAVITSCDGKTCAGDQAVLTLAQDAAVFVAVDIRVTAKPAFLEGFADTGESVYNSSGVEYTLYSKRFSAGDRVILGTNGQSSSCVNYTAFVTQLTGDTDADGKADAADAALLARFLTAQTAALPDWRSADLNGDGRLNAADLTLIKRLLMRPSETVWLEGYPKDPDEPAQPQTNAYEAADFQFSGRLVLVGDSTVCDYDAERMRTLNRYGWGQKIGSCLNGVSVSNLALSGRSSRSFLSEGNYQTMCSSLKAGDYLLIQFGHNDEKTDESENPGVGTFPGLDFATLDGSGKNSSGQYSYEWILLNKYVKVAQKAGAQPVLITPITRRGSSGTPNYSGHTDYQNAVLTLGKQYNIPVIDGTALTTQLYNNAYASGGAEATAAFHCWKDAEHTTIDNTHLSEHGAQTIAEIIAAQLRVLGLKIGDSVK